MNHVTGPRPITVEHLDKTPDHVTLREQMKEPSQVLAFIFSLRRLVSLLAAFFLFNCDV